MYSRCRDDGKSSALRFVGTIISEYYISLLIFYWMPTTGPNAICPNHFSVSPAGTSVYELQKALVESLNRLHIYHTKSVIGMDYFIGIPSMHVVQPLIVLWFLRSWKRVVIALIAFDVLLIPAILLLEQHYLMDLLAAIPVAIVAILICRKN